MKTIQEMLQDLSQCIVTVSGEFRFRTNWSGGKVPQPDLDVFDPNVPFCIENVGDYPVEFGLYNSGEVYSGPPIISPARMNCKISYDLKSWQDYEIVLSRIGHTTDVNKIMLQNKGDRVYIKADYKANANRPVYTNFVFTGTESARYRARGNVVSLNMGTDDKYKTDYLEMKNDRDSYRFYKLFDSCIGLTQAPELPATTLANYCYSYMFKACWALTQAPELPATTLADGCYYSMFRGCTQLVNAPELPATKLAYMCYNSMFDRCTSLAQAPELPATTLANSCYSAMFSNCTSLTRAPELPATTLADHCYYSMFSGCTKSNYVKCLATDISATDCTKDWLKSVSSSGTFECDNKKYFTVDSPNGIPTGWTITEINPDPPTPPEPEKPDLDVFDPNVPFCIENVGDTPVEIGLYNYNGKAVRSNCKISTDLKTWSDYNIVLTDDSTSNDIGRILLQNKGDRVYIKADMTPFGSYVPSPYPHTKFKVFNQSDSKKIRARGNIASLIYGTNDAYVNKYTSTERYCYYNMFGGCTSLVQAPELPATKLTEYCYSGMFGQCKSLVQAPELPATTLAVGCYKQMFWYCASLTQVPKLPATTLADYCYYYMFAYCKSLTQAPALPATTVYDNCYCGMFSGCASLTQAPELPATNLAYECYYDMFSGCTSLTQAPELPATTLAEDCYRGMFGNCTSLTQAPELPSTTLTSGCYLDMFSRCEKLRYVKCLATDTSATSCTQSWLYGVSYKGDFYTPAATNWTTDSYSGIPQGWTRHDINPDPPTPPEPEKPDLDTFDPNVPFCIENVGDVPVEIGMYNYYTEAVRTNCEISYDLQTWQNYNLPITQDANSTTISKITLTNKGDRVYIKADLITNPGSFSIITVFNKSSTKKIRARGNIASLNKGTNDAYKTDYLTADSYCYANLFSACGLSLTQAPDLPATTLSSNCYDGMFKSCTQLVNAPELPATTLAYMCYSNMFNGCASLTQAPELPATTLSNYCYSGMFYGCTSLTRAPELPATTLPIVCYENMFNGCTKLNYVKCLATDISAANCTASWLKGVSTTGDFYAPVTTRWTTDSYSGIPRGWTRHNV